MPRRRRAGNGGDELATPHGLPSHVENYILLHRRRNAALCITAKLATDGRLRNAIASVGILTHFIRPGKDLPFWQPRNRGVQEGIEMEGHAMSLVRNGYALSTRREFLWALFSALLGLALFDPGVATAQEGKQIKLTEKHIQSFMGAYNDMVKVYESADPDKPDDPKVDAQAEAIAKKNGFASLAEFDDVSASISTVI